jgi:hypothetical protein
MLNKLVDFLHGDITQTTIGVLLSVLSLTVAVYIQRKVVRLTKRDRYWTLQFKEKVGPWMTAAHIGYSKGKFHKNDNGTSRSN